MAKTKTTKAKRERGANGQFKKGHKGGPGNPKLRAYHDLRNRLLEVVSQDDFDEIVLKLVEKAKAGEPWAVKDILDRMVGKPKQQVEVSGTAIDFVAQCQAAMASMGGSVPTSGEGGE